MQSKLSGECHQDQRSSLPGTPRTGVGPTFTLILCMVSLCIGVAAGMAADGSLEMINAYQVRQLKLAATADVRPRKPSSATIGAPASFPENNTLEWSTSLAPGETPAPLDVLNESEATNKRILFYAIGKLAPRLTATLYVRAGQKALVHLPLGRYRVDVASTAMTMPWENAQSVAPVTVYAFSLPADDQENDPSNHLTLDNGGKVRFVRMNPIVIEGQLQPSAQDQTPEART